MSDAPLGRWGISEELRTFVEEVPFERRGIVAFVREAADSLSPGTVVLDLGAGDAPYRELFDHCEYITADWEQSQHERSREVDLVTAAEALPLADGTVDAVLLTQVLEHVPDPALVLREAARALKPGGRVVITVPFVWELHELPHDYWRFTPSGLEHLLTAAGFGEIVIKPRSDCFTTLAQLMHNVGTAMGRAPDEHDHEREAAAQLLDEFAGHVAALGPLDVEWIFPLGWNVTAVRG